jgi:hypothetical protein
MEDNIVRIANVTEVIHELLPTYLLIYKNSGVNFNPIYALQTITSD